MKEQNIGLIMANNNVDINIRCTQGLQRESCDLHLYTMQAFGPALYWTYFTAGDWTTYFKYRRNKTKNNPFGFGEADLCRPW